ncbi:uncharacterized protein [Antedon mediterranea]|uniref:uncharacterized protein n=1 Tax=Antedon mediterranea TaxID=105859 RepID=UPI003AF52672
MILLLRLCVCLAVVVFVNAATDTHPDIPKIPDGTEPASTDENIDNELSPETKPTKETKDEIIPTPNVDEDVLPTAETPTGTGFTHRPPRPPTVDNPTLYHYIPVPGPPGMPGPTGTTGNPGYPGPQGPMGYAGAPGNNGNNGSPGPAGRQGSDGQKGERGSPGITGDPGVPGASGTNGERGARGPMGDRGQMGPSGRTGARGVIGPTGPKGSRGAEGKPGSSGMRGFPGSCDCTQSLVYQRAFSVARTTSLTASNGHMIITWNHEFSNVGGDFDMSTGMFNVTIPGTYFFTIHVYKSSRQNFPLVQLLKNGDHVIGVIDYGPNDSEDSSGNSVVLNLTKGDAVWLLLYDGKEIYSSHYKFTTFSGFLLFPNFE